MGLGKDSASLANATELRNRRARPELKLKRVPLRALPLRVPRVWVPFKDSFKGSIRVPLRDL